MTTDKRCPSCGRPKLLDLFAGAGGCSVGFDRAGFCVDGVDDKPHPDYPFQLTVADAMDVLADHATIDAYAVIHASPPCPRYSIATHARGNQDNHPDLVGPVQIELRSWAARTGGLYTIENVPGAPLDTPVLLCGWAMGLKHIRRHRMWESNAPLMSPGCLCPHGDTVSVFGHSGEDRRKESLREHGTSRKHVPAPVIRKLMGVEWMTSRDDVSDSIPPAYTEYLGEQLADQLAREAIA